MRAGDLPGPCVYCSSQTFGKRDKYIGKLLPFFSAFASFASNVTVSVALPLFCCLQLLSACLSVLLSVPSSSLRCFACGGASCSWAISWSLFLFSFHAGSPDISRRLPGPLPSSGVVVFTTYTYRPFCSDFCSVLLSPMFCLWLCFLRLAALLFSSPFSFRDGIPDIGNGACRFFFRFLPGDFRLRCSDPLYCFADASPGNDVIPAVLTDLVTIARTMLCQPTFERERSLLYMAYAASQPAPCLPRTSQAYSAAVACPFPHSGRKTRFVLSSFLSPSLSLSLPLSLQDPPNRGVGGTRALAHSISHYIPFKTPRYPIWKVIKFHGSKASTRNQSIDPNFMASYKVPSRMVASEAANQLQLRRVSSATLVGIWLIHWDCVYDIYIYIIHLHIYIYICI